MATTDSIEWRLFDPDLITVKGYLPVIKSHLYLELNEPGSGQIDIRLDSAIVSDVESGAFVESKYRGSVRGGFFIENIKKAHAESGEGESRLLTMTGRGALALLDDAIVWDNGTGETTREFAAATKAATLIDLLQEAQTRGALASLTWDFSDTQDSAAAPETWTDSEALNFPVGRSMLDVLRQMADLGIDFEINPNGLGGFILSAYKSGLGSDKHATVYFRVGSNCIEVSDEETGGKIRNVLRIKYVQGFTTVKDTTSITNRRRREAILNTESAPNPTVALAFGQAELAGTKDPIDSRTVKIFDGVYPRLFEDYVLGDTITLDRFGVEASYRIRGIQATWDGEKYADVTLNLNSLPFENSIRLSRDVKWLQDLWNTAHDANLLNATEWKELTGANAEVRSFYLDGSNLYVGGLFTSIGGILANHIAVYNINTQTWNALGAGLAGDGGTGETSCYAITKFGSDIVITGSFLTADGVANTKNIAKWDGVAFTPFGTGLDLDGRTLQVIGGDFYVGGRFSTANGVAAPYLAKWTGATFTAVTAGGANTSQYALAAIGTDLYGYGVVGGAAVWLKKYNTVAMTWSNIGEFLGGAKNIECMLTVGTDLYIGGSFTSIGGVSALNIAKYNGSIFSALEGGVDATCTALAYDGINIYAGGHFINVDGTDMYYLARWDSGTWSMLGSGIGPTDASTFVRALACFEEGVYVGGNFATAGGLSSPNFAIYLTSFQAIIDYASSASNFDMAAAIHNATEKHPLVAADEMGFWDSVSHALRKISWSNIMASITNTAERVFITNASGVITTDSNLGFDATGKVLTIGTLSAEFSPAGGHNSIYQGSDGFSVANLLETFGTGVASFITGVRGRGTHLAPTAVQADDIALRLRGRMYDGASSVGLTSVEIELVANETHTASAHGTRIEFYTTPNGSITSTKVLTIAHDGSAQLTRNDAAAGVSAMLGLTALGSGANGDGGSILFAGKTSTTVAQPMGLIDYRWIDATHANRKAALRFYAYDTAARLGLEIEASGTAPKIAFYGGTTVVRGAALTAQLTTITHTAPGTSDYAIQDFAQNGGAGIWGFADHDEANSVLKVIANLQTRVAELEARLGSATGVNLFA